MIWKFVINEFCDKREHFGSNFYKKVLKVTPHQGSNWGPFTQKSRTLPLDHLAHITNIENF